ncbi:hypothetical protein EGR_10677 [Echinococcus granulosus]|uniref:Uncharacterized protein n=1 Tax=Echinococcus granulosus TaxID=6210 RepID=W6ULW3_ECHGR|nr:hypothetical protein EGR_10677 [Echinococcus granulosus]EUB54464.1 hypothetical protein EGR_10677 [Echinococcus granulosus]
MRNVDACFHGQQIFYGRNLKQRPDVQTTGLCYPTLMRSEITRIIKIAPQLQDGANGDRMNWHNGRITTHFKGGSGRSSFISADQCYATMMFLVSVALLKHLCESSTDMHVMILCRPLAILLPLVCQQHRPLIDALISARAYMHKHVQLSFLALHGRSYEMAGDDRNEKQFNGNTHKHEEMVKESTEGVSKDTPGTHSSDSTQAKSNWKKVTTLLVLPSRFMGGVKKGE